jgi:hypothetical protein
MGIYDQLNTQTAGNVTKTDYDRVSNPIHIQEKNKQALQDRVDVGLASNMLSTSGPIPGTSKCIQISETSNGTYSFFTPGPGEVWLVTGVGTGTMNGTAVLKIEDSASSVSVEVGQESSSNLVFEPAWKPLYIDENVNLVIVISSATGTCKVNAAFIRVR